MHTFLAAANPIELATEKLWGMFWLLIPALILLLVFHYYFNRFLKTLGAQKKGSRNRR